MKQLLFITLFFCLTLFAKSQDTVFIKESIDLNNGKRAYKTDTFIYEGSLQKHILIGTTILTSTHNQMIAKNFGLSLKKVSSSNCLGNVSAKGILNKINSVKITEDELLVDINISDNCCYSFLCDIEIKNDSILNLIYHGYGAYCSCDCCFGLTYSFSKDDWQEFKKIKSIMINGDMKTLKPLK